MNEKGAPNGVPAFPVADRWFDATSVGNGVTILVEPNVDPFWQSNSWHVRGRDRDLLVDTGNGIGDLRRELVPLVGDHSVVAVVTHAHFDHMGSLHAFDERVCDELEAPDVERPFELPLLERDFPPSLVELIHAYGFEPPSCVVTALPSAGFDLERFRTRAASPTRVVSDGDTIDLGDRSFEVLHVPGHTRGSLALWEEESRSLFVGDTVSDEEPVIVDDRETYVASLERLRGIPVRTAYPGHGPTLDRARFLRAIDRLASAT